jgi:transposase
MNSTIGRPRKLTDAQVGEILAWYQSRKTLEQVASEYGVSKGVIHNVIRYHGLYKQPSPELRAQNQNASRRRRRRLKALHLM